MMTHRLPPWHRRRGKETVEKACVYLHRDRGSTGEPAENARPDHNRTDVLASDFEKQDRTLRLMRELVLFQAIPRGLTSRDRKSTRLNSSHVRISYAGFCLKKQQ